MIREGSSILCNPRAASGGGNGFPSPAGRPPGARKSAIIAYLALVLASRQPRPTSSAEADRRATVAG